MKRKASETVFEAIRLAEELVVGGGLAENPEERDAQAGRLYELEDELRKWCRRAEESNTKVKETGNSKKEAERTREKPLVTYRNPREAANEERLEATREREELAKARK